MKEFSKKFLRPKDLWTELLPEKEVFTLEEANLFDLRVQVLLVAIKLRQSCLIAFQAYIPEEERDDVADLKFANEAYVVTDAWHKGEFGVYDNYEKGHDLVIKDHRWCRISWESGNREPIKYGFSGILQDATISMTG